MANDRTPPTLAELVRDMRAISAQVDGLVSELRERSEAAAREDCLYREAFSRAMLAHKASDKRMTNAEAEARADLDTIDQRTAAKIAEALADAAKQALLARRTQLSALQSIASAVREELAFSRTSPF